MHELAIAGSVVRIVCEHAGGRRVARVELKVGRLRQVVPSSLAFAFELVATGTEAEGAELVIEDVPVTGRCRGCATESVLAERRKTARTYGAQDQRGWLGVYQRTVAPVHEGAVLAPKAPSSR